LPGSTPRTTTSARLALSVDNLNAVEILLALQTEKDSNKPLGPVARLVDGAVGTEGCRVEDQQQRVLQPRPRRSPGRIRWYKRFGAERRAHHRQRAARGPNDWYCGTLPTTLRSSRSDYLDGYTEPQILLANLPTQGTQFTNDQLQYKVEVRVRRRHHRLPRSTEARRLNLAPRETGSGLAIEPLPGSLPGGTSSASRRSEMKKVLSVKQSPLMRGIAFALVALMLMVATAPPAQAQKTYRDATSGFLNETAFVPSAAYTTSASNITPVDIGGYASGIVVINVTAVSGTSPSLTVNFQTCSSTPGSSTAPANANCVVHTASSAITATGVYLVKVDHFARWNTVSYAITGTTPSFTMTSTVISNRRASRWYGPN
jgi:hypothetical protein